jgi:hypothetical protein
VRDTSNKGDRVSAAAAPSSPTGAQRLDRGRERDRNRKGRVLIISEHARPESWSTLNGFRLAISVDGTLTGRGGDIIIIDDPIAALAGALSQKAREHVDWYFNTLLSPHDLGDPPSPFSHRVI